MIATKEALPEAPARSLYSIERDMEALDEILFSVEGVFDGEEQEKAVDQWLDENREHAAEKLNGYRSRIRRFEQFKGETVAELDIAKKEKERLELRVKRFDTDIKWMSNRLLNFIQRWGTPIKGKETRQYETPTCTFSEVLNGGLRALKYLVKPEHLPEELQVHTITITCRAGYASVCDKITAALLEAKGSEVLVEHAVRANDEEVRSALERGELERARREDEQDRTGETFLPLPDERIFNYALLEERGRRLQMK